MSNERPAAGQPSRVVVISPATSQPRYHRRIRALIAEGYEVSVYTFTRGYYEVNEYPPGVEVVQLGLMPYKKNVRRLAYISRAIARVRGLERGRSGALVYAFGLEAALIGLTLRSRKGLIYEVGDLRAHRFSTSVKQSLICTVERSVLRRADVTVVTSEGFLPHFQRQNSRGGASPVVIRNRLAPELPDIDPRRPGPRRPKGRIRIGFAGFLRYEGSFNALLDAVARRPERYVLEIHGDGPLRGLVSERANRYSNIRYHGSFRSPEDLGRIYRSIDLNFVVYSSVYYNVRVAIPNKLFESLYYGVPLVAASTTFLAEEVVRTGAGFVVNPQEAGYFDRFLDELSPEEVSRASRCALKVPTEQLLLNHGPLLDRVAALMDAPSAG